MLERLAERGESIVLECLQEWRDFFILVEDVFKIFSRPSGDVFGRRLICVGRDDGLLNWIGAAGQQKQTEPEQD